MQCRSTHHVSCLSRQWLGALAAANDSVQMQGSDVVDSKVNTANLVVSTLVKGHNGVQSKADCQGSMPPGVQLGTRVFDVSDVVVQLLFDE